MSDYPEAEKVSKARDEGIFKGIQTFLDYLEDKGYTICKIDDDDRNARYTHVTDSKDKMIAEAIGVDYEKYEKEKQLMLEKIREG